MRAPGTYAAVPISVNAPWYVELYGGRDLHWLGCGLYCELRTLTFKLLAVASQCSRYVRVVTNAHLQHYMSHTPYRLVAMQVTLHFSLIN